MEAQKSVWCVLSGSGGGGVGQVRIRRGSDLNGQNTIWPTMYQVSHLRSTEEESLKPRGCCFSGPTIPRKLKLRKPLQQQIHDLDRVEDQPCCSQQQGTQSKEHSSKDLPCWNLNLFYRMWENSVKDIVPHSLNLIHVTKIPASTLASQLMMSLSL